MGRVPELPKRLPVLRMPAGTRWMRIHIRHKDPLWFGPKPGSPPVNRFDDPQGEFRVCYLGTTWEACFAETFLRNPPVRLVTFSDLAARSFATFELRRAIRLVPLFGPGLARLGATAEVAAGPSYGLAQAWSRVIWEHTDAPEGIAYRSRHDDSALCIALFNRARTALATAGSRPLTDDVRLLGRLLKRYALGLTH